MAVAALYHDATEIITGDMPTPVKYYNSTLRDSYKQVEAAAMTGCSVCSRRSCGRSLSPICGRVDPEIHAYVKAADKLSAYLKCVEGGQGGQQ